MGEMVRVSKRCGGQAHGQSAPEKASFTPAPGEFIDWLLRDVSRRRICT